MASFSSLIRWVCREVSEDAAGHAGEHDDDGHGEDVGYYSDECVDN